MLFWNTYRKYSSSHTDYSAALPAFLIATALWPLDLHALCSSSTKGSVPAPRMGASLHASRYRHKQHLSREAGAGSA